MKDVIQIERLPRVMQHLAFWTIYIVLQSLISQNEFTFWDAVLHNLISLPGKLIAVYINLLLLIPQFLFKGKIIKYGVTLVGNVLTASLVQLFIVYGIFKILGLNFQGIPADGNITFWMMSYGALAMYDVFVTGCLKIIKEFYSQGQRHQEMESKRLMTELQFLKYQINPHFFFNTLNNLYGMALTGDKRTAQIVLKMSDIMSFVLYDASPSLIPLSKEVKVIRDYLELESLRRRDSPPINFHDVCEADHMIPPLLLLPLVENAFKHGYPIEGELFFINILLTSNVNEIEFVIENCVNPEKPASPKGGIGLINLRRRLELMYAGKYDLSIRGPVNKIFVVRLRIQID